MVRTRGRPSDAPNKFILVTILSPWSAGQITGWDVEEVASIFRPQSGEWSPGGTSSKPTGLFPKNEYTEASGRPQDFTTGCSNRKQFGGPCHRRTKVLFFQPAGQECTEKQKDRMWRIKTTPMLGSSLAQHPRPAETPWTTPCYHELLTPLVSVPQSTM